VREGGQCSGGLACVGWAPTAVASLRWHWQFPDFVFFSRRSHFRLPCGVPVMLCKALAWAKPESLLLFRLSKTRMRRAGRAGRAWHISARHKVASYSTVATRAAVFTSPCQCQCQCQWLGLGPCAAACLLTPSWASMLPHPPAALRLAPSTAHTHA
jgi:hypothetical protein